MNWRGFLDTAGHLASGNAEGDWRSAASRAYYAVFHYFHDFFHALGLDLGRGGQSHFNLYSGLLNCGEPAVAKIRSKVDRLRADRVTADYDLRTLFDSRRAGKAVQDAHGVIAAFQALLQTIPAVQIVAGARRHLQAIGKLGKMP